MGRRPEGSPDAGRLEVYGVIRAPDPGAAFPHTPTSGATVLTIRAIRSGRAAPWGTVVLPPRSDDELLCDAGAGDPQAFSILRDRVTGLVCLNLARTLGDRSRAASLTEEVLTEVWRQAVWFDPSRTTAVVWILDLAHQLATERGAAVAAPSAGAVE